MPDSYLAYASLCITDNYAVVAEVSPLWGKEKFGIPYGYQAYAPTGQCFGMPVGYQAYSPLGQCFGIPVGYQADAPLGHYRIRFCLLPIAN